MHMDAVGRIAFQTLIESFLRRAVPDLSPRSHQEGADRGGGCHYMNLCVHGFPVLSETKASSM